MPDPLVFQLRFTACLLGLKDALLPTAHQPLKLMPVHGVSREECLFPYISVWYRKSRSALDHGLGFEPTVRARLDVSSTVYPGRVAFWGNPLESTAWTLTGEPTQESASAASSHQEASPVLTTWKIPCASCCRSCRVCRAK